MSFCPTCPRDERGNLRELLEANGTKCSCGYELPLCPTEFLKISAKKRTDDRRNKRYHRTVSIFFTDPRPEALRARYDLRKTLTPRPLKVETYDPNYRGWESRGEEFKPHQIELRFRIEAEKPSKIVSEDRAIAQFRSVLYSLTGQINKFVMRLASEEAKKTNREHVAKQATRFAKWIGESVREKALEITGYEQRLAALEAELAAEVEVQLEKFNADNADKGATDYNAVHEDDQFCDEAVEIAKAHAATFTKTGEGFFHTSPEITPDEVAEHRGEKESA